MAQAVLSDFSSTLVLSSETDENGDLVDGATADGYALASFLLIREILGEISLVQSYLADPLEMKNGRVVCEIVDSQNSKSLLREMGFSSYVMSLEIVSACLAQVRILWICLMGQ